MSEFDIEDPLTSTSRPITDSVLTVRIIKSFPYRNVRNHVYQHIDLKNTTPKKLLEDVKRTIQTDGAFRPYRNVNLDAIKIYTHAHGTKTINLAINMDHDYDWWLDINEDTKTLAEYGISNETEISVFNKADYEEYKANPTDKWI
ncbi:Aim29 protein [Martiniozyma asiatica (nom. inval.)]|nr:Aim29 protein [Martiniozyma asiatica]